MSASIVAYSWEKVLIDGNGRRAAWLTGDTATDKIKNGGCKLVTGIDDGIRRSVNCETQIG
jgi:hypothetical protein